MFHAPSILFNFLYLHLYLREIYANVCQYAPMHHRLRFGRFSTIKYAKHTHAHIAIIYAILVLRAIDLPACTHSIITIHYNTQMISFDRSLKAHSTQNVFIDWTKCYNVNINTFYIVCITYVTHAHARSRSRTRTYPYRCKHI